MGVDVTIADRDVEVSCCCTLSNGYGEYAREDAVTACSGHSYRRYTVLASVIRVVGPKCQPLSALRR